MLTFDEAAHRYYWNARPVPNVTSVLAPLTDYSMIPADRLELARQKGVAVHKTIELWCRNDLDCTNLPKWLEPVVMKWTEFVMHTGFRIIDSEKRVYHSTFCYAGTLDLFGYLERHNTFALIDLKRSFFAGKAIGLQLAAYLAAYVDQEKHRGKARRFALRLNESAPVRLQEFDDAGQFGEFCALLTAQRVMEKYRP